MEPHDKIRQRSAPGRVMKPDDPPWESPSRKPELVMFLGKRPWLRALLKWILVLSLACTLAGISMRTAGWIGADRLYWQTEARVLDGTLARIATLEKVVAGSFDCVIEATIRDLAMRIRIHDLVYWLFTVLGLAMVMVELIRGVREMRQHDWKCWGIGLATIALPCLIAILYYGTHSMSVLNG